MSIRRYMGTASIAATLAFSFSGSVFAADVSVSNTGPDSTNKVAIENKSEVKVTNSSDIQISNVNVQEAKTGDVDAKKNTSVGELQSGDAANDNHAATAVAISNSSASVLPVGGSGQGGNSTSGNGPTGGIGGSGGNVLGASAVGGLGGGGLGGAVLPEVGAAFPVDVSALRAAWHPQTDVPTAALAKGSRMFTAAMLIIATMLSLLGALGSAFYARRRQERV